MTPERFRALYEGEFFEDRALPQAVALWRFYYEQCEAYDRTVCTGPIAHDGGILPATPEQQGFISRHARAQHVDTMRAAAEAGIPENTMRRAREIALRDRR